MEANRKVTKTMCSEMIHGAPSTMNDGYQLSMINIIRHAARTYHDSEIVYPMPGGKWSRYSYEESYDRISNIGASLTKLGVSPGDTVGVASWNTREYFELYWAVPALGAVLLQINVRSSRQHIIHAVTHSKVSWIIIDESLHHLTDDLLLALPNLKGWIVIADNRNSYSVGKMRAAHLYDDLLATRSSTFDWPEIAETSACSACYTGGTTGHPKGVYYSHRSLYLQTLYLVALHSLRLTDSILLITPMFHVNCWGLPHAAVFVGAKIVLSGPYKLTTIIDQLNLLEAERVTFMSAVPTLLQAIAETIHANKRIPDFSELRILCGGGKPTDVVVEYLENETKATIVHAFGSTESSALIAINQLKPTLRNALSYNEQRTIKQKQGLPVVGMDIKLISENHSNEEQSKAEAKFGELCVRAPWIATSYYGSDAAISTEAFDADGYWKSGDLVAIDDDGYLEVYDRTKDVIKSGGEWISSSQLENAIQEIDGVRAVAVIGLRHPRWEERPLAVIVSDPEKNLTLETINTKLQEAGFERWQELDAIVLVDTLELTSVGKTDKVSLRRRFKDYFFG